MDNSNILFAKNSTTGTITSVNAINGNTIITTPNFIRNLDDVSITSNTTNQSLVYNATTGKWANQFLTLAGLSDCNISNPQNNQYIKYDPSTSKFINRALNYCYINYSGKIKDSLFPTSSYQNLLKTSTYTSLSNQNQTANGITVNNTDGYFTGLQPYIYYLINVKINMNPTSLSAANLTIIVCGSNTLGTWSVLTNGTSILSFNNQVHTMNISNNVVYTSTTPYTYYTVQLFYGGSYTGITADDFNMTLTVQEL